MSRVLVDSNVLLDVLTDDPRWYAWSAAQLDTCATQGDLAINSIIYAEVSVGFKRIEDLDAALMPDAFLRLPLPWEAGFLAGKAFLGHRPTKSTHASPWHGLYIGAHAAIEGMPLLTRDAKRYRSHYPKLELICPRQPTVENPYDGNR